MAFLGSSHPQHHRGWKGAQKMESCSIPHHHVPFSFRLLLLGAVLSLPLRALSAAAVQGTALLELPFGQPVNNWAAELQCEFEGYAKTFRFSFTSALWSYIHNGAYLHQSLKFCRDVELTTGKCAVKVLCSSLHSGV